MLIDVLAIRSNLQPMTKMRISITRDFMPVRVCAAHPTHFVSLHDTHFSQAFRSFLSTQVESAADPATCI